MLSCSEVFCFGDTEDQKLGNSLSVKLAKWSDNGRRFEIYLQAGYYCNKLLVVACVHRHSSGTVV